MKEFVCLSTSFPCLRSYGAQDVEITIDRKIRLPGKLVYDGFTYIALLP